MGRRTNADKGKGSLENIGVKVESVLKKAIEDESTALGISTGTYARQLLMYGWQSRHEAPIAKNPREVILTELFKELPLSEQENVLAIVETLHNKHVRTPQRLARLDSREDVERLMEDLNDGNPLVKKTPENRQ